MILSIFVAIEMEKKLLEERTLKQKVENLLLEAEKRCSILDCDFKQSQQKINELLKQKDVLNEDVSMKLTNNELFNKLIANFICNSSMMVSSF